MAEEEKKPETEIVKAETEKPTEKKKSVRQEKKELDQKIKLSLRRSIEINSELVTKYDTLSTMRELTDKEKVLKAKAEDTRDKAIVAYNSYVKDRVGMWKVAIGCGAPICVLGIEALAKAYGIILDKNGPKAKWWTPKIE